MVMPDLEPKSVVARIYDAFNEREASALDELLATDFVDHTAGPRQKPGPTGIKEVWSWIWSRHPGVRIRVEDFLAECDKVATRATLNTKQGNREIKVGWLIEITQVTSGKATALWNMIHWSPSEE